MMFETKDKIRQKDIEELAQNELFEQLNTKRVLITGASGLIGSEAVFAILCANRLKNLEIKVCALVRDIKKTEEIFENVLNDSNFEILQADIKNEIIYDKKIDYIIHAASMTSSSDFVNKAADTILTSTVGTANVLELARKNNVKSFVYLSSLEVYGILDSREPVSESVYGNLDSLNARSSYALGKKLAENLCIAYFEQYGLGVKIARLAQTFGAGVSKDDNRVFAQFSKSVIKNEDIILHTKGGTTRNYCYLTDAVSALLTILLKGENANAYNVANQDTCVSIKQMAQMLANKYNLCVRHKKIENENIYNPQIKICLDTAKLLALGWCPSVNLEQMFDRTIESMRQDY